MSGADKLIGNRFTGGRAQNDRTLLLAFSYSYSGTFSACSEAMQTNGVPSQMSGVVHDVHQHPGLAAVSEIPGITESSGEKLGMCA